MTNTVSTVFQKLEETVFVAPQIRTEQISDIIDSGIKTVICHRPDEEIMPEFSQITPYHQNLSEQLKQHDIELIYQPIYNISMPQIEELAKILKEKEQPVLMYCASGTRSAIVWGLSQVLIEQRPKPKIIQSAENAGYAISQYLP